MEVERESFMAMMPTMLKHISQAHFVAFDLELSGIPTRKHNSSHGRQTLQQRYHEVKRAAETFHILQVGLTCVEQDEENEQYLLRAYNFNLSPLVGDGLNVEREFTYSTGAVEFLLSVGYSMDAPYKDGVPYMTREETKDARKRTMERWDRASIPDINIRPDDAQALDFMQRARDQIDDWENKWRNVDKVS
jgi:poly(A)-specific ribonuclease